MEELSQDDIIVGLTREMMLNTARGCLLTMEIIKDDHRISSWHLPYYILAATSLELFPKVVLIRRMRENGDNIDKIKRSLRNINHHLEKIFSEEKIGKDFLDKANISKVELTKRNGVFRYDFYKNNNNPIYVYHPESIRYGLFADDRSNPGFVAYQTDPLLQLLQSVFEATQSFG